MDYLQKFIQQFRFRLFILLLASNLILLLDWFLADQVFKLVGYWLVAFLVIIPLLSLTILPWLSAKYLTQPIKLLWQTILHIAPHSAEQVPAPNTKSLGFGKELVTTLAAQLYEFANVADKVTSSLEKKNADMANNSVANDLPLPLLACDKNQMVIFANVAAEHYMGIAKADLVGKHLYTVLDMAFDDTETLDVWLNSARSNTVTSTHTWNRVKLSQQESGKTLLFDLAAYYNKAASAGYETLLTLFDHSAQYGENEQAISFVTIAVHELRTPLTLLRGYIEALDEDMAGKLPENDVEFLRRMNAAGQQLAIFVNNILNVARIDDDQFMMQLHEEQWLSIVTAVVDDMQLRAKVQGINIAVEVAPDLPTVGVDRVSIYEVLSNLLDNAIKYSADSKKVIVKSYLSKGGMVETTVQDFGAGIAESVVPHLFDKFYRNHRTREQISGTGLGLYLSKALVTAHGGNIWVRSKEGQGSVFGFTVQPFARLTVEAKGQPQDFTRMAHGWIKNHSLYRR